MLTTREQNIIKTYFYFGLLPRISVGKTPFFFLVHVAYVDWQSPPYLPVPSGRERLRLVQGRLYHPLTATNSRMDINTQTKWFELSQENQVNHLGKHSFCKIASSKNNIKLDLYMTFTTLILSIKLLGRGKLWFLLYECYEE